MSSTFVDFVGYSKRVEDFHGPGLKAVGLAFEDFRCAFVDDPYIDAALGHPQGGHETVFLVLSAVKLLMELTLQVRPQ